MRQVTLCELRLLLRLVARHPCQRVPRQCQRPSYVPRRDALDLSLTSHGSVSSSDVKSRIDSMAAADDCAGPQAEFDNADANNDATMSRTGHNNAQLMGYIDDAMRGAGCYG